MFDPHTLVPGRRFVPLVLGLLMGSLPIHHLAVAESMDADSAALSPVPVPTPLGEAPGSPPEPPVAPDSPPAPAVTLPPKIEGRYQVEGSPEVIWVRRLFTDVYQLTSSNGWEGIGMLAGSTYHGVFRFRRWPHSPEGPVGVHTIDWSVATTPRAQVEYDGPSLVQHEGPWQRTSSPRTRASWTSSSS